MTAEDATPSRPSSRALTSLGVIALLVLLAGMASAQNTTQVTIEAREDCPETTFCFDVTGDIGDAEPGDVLDITFVNPEDNLQEHNVYLALGSEANVGDEEATEPRVAFANTEDVSPGNETTLSAEIPEDAEGLYLWCTVRAHEQQGMNREVELAGVEEETENGSPGFTAVAVLGSLVGLAALTRRG